MDKKHSDTKLIEALGGTCAVAAMCDIRPPSVSEWKHNGIPKAQYKYLRLLRPEVVVAYELRAEAESQAAANAAIEPAQPLRRRSNG